MKTNKLLGGIALAATLATGMTAFGAGGDIFEIRPCAADGTATDAYSTLESPMSVGEWAYFNVRLIQRTAGDDNTVWRLVHVGATSEIVDDALYPLQIGIYVSGRLTYATLKECKADTANGFTDLIFAYQTKVGDFATPILLATETGPASDADTADLAYKLNRTDKWRVRNANGDDAKMWFWTPNRPASSPDGGGRKLDYSLSQCGFFVRSIDFASNWETPKTDALPLWRSVHQNSTQTIGTPVALDASAAVEEAITLYVWSDDESAVKIKNGTPMNLVTGYDSGNNPIIKQTQVAEVVFERGRVTSGFSIEGVAENGTANLVLSAWPNYNYSAATGVRITDYITVPVKCIEPLPASVVVESDTLTAVADGDYLVSKARLSVYLTQAVSVPVTVTVTPAFEDGHTEPWGNYVRFSPTQDTVQTLPGGSTLPTVTIPAGSTAKYPLYVYTLRGDAHTIGDGHQVQFNPTISAEDSAASGIDMASMVSGAMWISSAKPVITSPTTSGTYEVTSGEDLEINVAVDDTYADVTDTTTGYTVQIKTGPSASWVELTEKFAASGEDGALVGLTSGKPPTMTYNGSGDYVSQVRVKAPISGKTSEIAYFNVHVAAARTTTCETTDDKDDTYEEGDTVRFKVSLSAPNDTPTTVYAFLLALDDVDLGMFGGNPCILTNDAVAAPATTGRPISVNGTSATGNFTVLDGSEDGQNYTFSVVLCTKKNYDPAYKLSGYPTTEMINIMVYNKAPTINTVYVNGFESETDGYTFQNQYPKGQNITIKTDIDDAAYDLTHGFQYKWTAIRNGSPRENKTVGHKADSDTLVAEGTSINDASFTYNFPQSGTWTVKIQALDKDLIDAGTSWSKAPVYSFNLNIIDSPTLMVEEKVISETDNRARIGLGIGFYEVEDASPIVVKVTVTPPDGTNPGKLTLANEYKTIPAGYETIVGTLAANEYLVSFTDASDQELVIDDLDGTRLSSSKGFTVKAEVITPTQSIDPTKSWAQYYNPFSAKVYIENIAPVLGNVTESQTNAWNVGGGMATDYPITWEVQGDVDADFTTLWADNSGPGVRVKFTGCDNPESERVRYVTTPFFGTFVPNFGTRQGLQTVVLTIEDKDGGSHRFEYKYFVRASKFLTTIANGPSGGTASSALSQRYSNRARGLGAGHTWVESGIFTGASSWRLKWNCSRRAAMSVYAWGYKTTDPVDDGDLDGTARYQHDIPLDPRGNNTTAGNVALSSYYNYPDAEKDSYLYVWLLNAVGENGGMTSQFLGSISPEKAGAGATAGIVPLPTEPVDEEDGSFAETYVEAVFSKEWRPLDNCGDINQDGIPDRMVVAYGFGVYNPETGELSGNDLDNVVSFNEDEDYLPGGYEGGNALTPNVSGSWSSKGGPFHVFYELRGFGAGLNAGYPNPDGSDPAPDYTPNEKRAWMLWKGVDDGDGNPVTEDGLKDMSDDDVDTLFAANVAAATADLKLANGSNGKDGWSPERPTDPTKDDTDGDDLPDGYEYWFWYGAKVGYSKNNDAGNLVWQGRMTGRRLDLADIEHFVTIPADDIVSAFDPLVNGGQADKLTGAAGSVRSRDFDNDGLSDYEEMLVGTNPVNCDTDGDGLPDGYEVMWGLNPLDDSDADGRSNQNPDGDFMAAATDLTYIEDVGWTQGGTIVEFDKDGLHYVYLTTVAEPEEGKPFKGSLLGPVEDEDANPLVPKDTVASIDDCVRSLRGETIPNRIAPAGVVDTEGVENFTVTPQYDIVLIHDQVRMLFGYDPRTGWYSTHNGFVSPRWDPSANPKEGDKLFLGKLQIGRAVNTRAYTTYQEYLYGKYKGIKGGNTVLARLKASCTNPNATFEDKTYGDSETTYASAQHGADTDGNGVPDGWEIYVGFDPCSNPNGTDNTLASDIDQDNLSLAGEYASTDGSRMFGHVASISNNTQAAGWYNKFFPTDPNDDDTDHDGIPDGDEAISWMSTFHAGNTSWSNVGFTFIYDSGIVDTNNLYLCLRGGGLNPCTADTDYDGLPDLWEKQHAGIVIRDGHPEGNPDDLYTAALKVADGFISTNVTASGCYIAGGMDATDEFDAATTPNANTIDEVTGTVRDRDFDGDGLQNWQEYLVQSIRLWRYDDAETPLMGRVVIWTGDHATTRLSDPVTDGYVPFDPTDSAAYYEALTNATELWSAYSSAENLTAAQVVKNGGFDFARLGYFAPCDREWDPMFLYGRQFMRVPSALIAYEDQLGTGTPRAQYKTSDFYLTTDPRKWDTDGDKMDDYWEIFHGINPILGDATDVISTGFATAGITAQNNVWCGMPGGSRVSDNPFTEIPDPGLDPFLAPWRMGLGMSDPDGDGLRNVDESVTGNMTSPTTYHTDPTPLWMTDTSSPMSYVSQYYLMGALGTLTMPWIDNPLGPGNSPAKFVGQGSSYVFAFEENEGYDTDGDWRSDNNEAIKGVMDSSDPLAVNDPRRRAALYLPGSDACAYSRMESNLPNTTAFDAFRQFTVEAWVKPERNGVDQTIIERGFVYPASNLQNSNTQWRANFRVALDPAGAVYGMFDNDNAIATSANESFSCQTLKGSELPLDEWTHVAVTFDGSRMSLYENGELKTSVMSGLIPANGMMSISQDPAISNNYPVAGFEALPGGMTIGARRAGVEFDWSTNFTAFADFYQGYVSEVRIWDGARTAAEIKGAYKTAMSDKDISGNRDDVFAAYYNNATRNDNDGNKTLPAQLVVLWNFAQLPSEVDPAQVSKTPAGFAQGVLDNCKIGGASGVTPDEAVVGWWNTASNLHSTVYDDYHVVPWIKNAVSVLPIYGGLFQDSALWSEHFAGYSPDSYNNVSTYAIPNGGNPYKPHTYTFDGDYRLWRLRRLAEIDARAGFAAEQYEFERNTQLQGNDALVPLGGAFAKRDSAFWDGQGSSTAWTDTAADSDGDGLPDWWEEYAVANYGADAATLTPATTVTRDGLDMTAAEAYVRDLARGMLPTKEFDPAYVNREDKDRDGLPDWWSAMYGLKSTGADDDDHDGLSNYTEYLLSEVFDLGVSFSPIDARSVNRYDTDYFFKIGQLYAGEIFTDHDMMEDDWEAARTPGYVSRYAWDAKSDNDEDRWSAFAECRYNTFVATMLGENISHMLGDSEVKDHPIPTLKLTLRYNQSQPLVSSGSSSNSGSGSGSNSSSQSATGGNSDENKLAPIVVQTYTAKGSQDLGVVPDATFKIRPGEAVDRYYYLGAWGNRVIRGNLTPGYVEAGDLVLQMAHVAQNNTYTWLLDKVPMSGTYTEYLYNYNVYGPERVVLQNERFNWEPVGTGDEISVSQEAESPEGYICYNGNRIGTINTQTGAFSLDLETFADSNQVSTNSTAYSFKEAVFRFAYKAKVPVMQQNKLTIYLGAANKGAVREGRNRVVAFYDLDDNGTYTPGEPLGFDSNVDVGWYSGAAEMELTDTSPVITRAAMLSRGGGSDSSEGGSGTSTDRILMWGNENGDSTNLIAGTLSGGKYQRFRVYRTLIGFADDVENNQPGWSVADLGVENRLIVDKTLELNQRSFFYEGDVLENSEFDIDWSNFYTEVVRNSNVMARGGDPLFAAYRIVLGEGDASINSTNNLFEIATVRHFDANADRQIPVPVAPGAQSAAVFGARPVFKWTMNRNKTYTAFRVQVTKAGSSTVVYDSGLRRAPATDLDGVYTFVPDAYAGDQLEATGNYRWHVSMFNSKFKNAQYSEYSQFRMNTLTNSLEYGSIRVCAKYFGPANVLSTGTVYVEAFTSPDFTGVPVARAKVANKASVSTVDAPHDANATLIGLPKGTYYVRAFIDFGSTYGADRKRNTYESWGYVCPRNGESEFMFSPTAIAIGDELGEGDVYTCYIEDVDTNGNCLPDAWEIVNNGGTLDDGTENIDDTLNSGVAINKSLTGNLQNLQGDGTASAGLAAYTFSVVKNAGVAALMLEADTSSASTYTAAIAKSGSSAAMTADSVKFTLISAADGSLSVEASGSAELVAPGGSGRRLLASTVYEVAGESKTLTGKIYTSTDLKNWEVATQASGECVKDGVVTVTVENGKFTIGGVNLDAYAGQQKRFFKIVMD